MPAIEPMKISLAAIVAATGESLPTIHSAIKLGHLKTFLVGRRRFARPEDVLAWVNFLEAESDAGRPVTYRPRSGEGEAKRSVAGV